ncbi:MAG: bacteriohopanetetrol glucosamine biosynthesis glycosyltransferase HpnI [Deltaproteobacteria bacterium]|nr:bacteriohopanetetrol glucosamine biosynthesis glycosyltransferase HpnI [Deltaproteobacteria bacterium]
MTLTAAAGDVLDVLLATSAAYSIAVAWVAAGFRRRASAFASEMVDAPGVSILVPLAGPEPTLAANLTAYCRLEYSGPVQLVVGSLDENDPALAVARRVRSDNPTVDIRVVAAVPDGGPNRKAVLLEALMRVARHPIVVAVDSDIRVMPDYLRRLVAVLQRPSVGLVTCYYRAPRGRSLAQAFEALCINADFTPSVMLATALGRADLAFGASLMLRRDTLEAIGGFAALADYLADDHRLAELVLDQGKRVVVAPYVVETDPNPADVGAAIRHQLRWARTTRACAPVGYAANIVTHGTTFALIGALPVGHASALQLGAAGAVMLLRLGAAALGGRAINARLGWTLWFVPLRDVVSTALWIASFAGDRVEWRGRIYRIARDGRLVEVEGVVALSPPAVEPAVRLPAQS